MLLFAVAHAVQLEDGIYAIRSPDFPGCEARHARAELAREQFGDALRKRLLEMIEAGEVPSLRTYEEIGSSFAARCSVQIPAPDRRKGTFDRVMAVRAKLPPEAERLKAVAPQREPHTTESRPLPGGEAEPAPRDTAVGDADHGRLGPSARLALVAARLVGRDRHVG